MPHLRKGSVWCMLIVLMCLAVGCGRSQESASESGATDPIVAGRPLSEWAKRLKAGDRSAYEALVKVKETVTLPNRTVKDRRELAELQFRINSAAHKKLQPDVWDLSDEWSLLDGRIVVPAKDAAVIMAVSPELFAAQR